MPKAPIWTRSQNLDTAIKVAIIGACATLMAALISTLLPTVVHQTKDNVGNSPHDAGGVILKGTVITKSGSGIPGIAVSIGKDTSDTSDENGEFTLRRVPTGDQTLEIRPKSGRGAQQRKIMVDKNPPSIKLIYDIRSSSLGLLSITYPANEGGWSISKWRERDSRGKLVEQYRANVTGTCEGLREQYYSLGIWVAIKSNRDSFWWVQRQATFSPVSNGWTADVLLGDPEHPPVSGERWDIVAVAAEYDSGISKFQTINAQLPNLNSLPPHVESNLVSVTVQ